MKKLHKRIILFLVNEDIINKSEVEYYEYGMQTLLIVFVHTFLFISIGIISDQIFNLIIFYFLFKIIREKSGGYHAKSKIVCFLLSIVVTVLLTLVIEVVPHNNYYIVSVISSVLTLLLAPVESYNKPLSEREICKLKVETFYIIIAFNVLYIVFISLNLYELSFIILYTELLCMISLIIPSVHRRINT